MDRKSIIAFAAVCICWSFSWFCIKIQFISPVSIYFSIFYRLFFAGAIILFSLLIAGKKVGFNTSEFRYFVALGLINGIFNFPFVYQACKYVPTGIVATMSATTIFFGEFIFCVYKRKLPNPMIILTSITGGLGMYLMFYHNLYDSYCANGIFMVGIVYCIIANIALALNYVLVAINAEKNKTSPFIASSYSAIFGGIVSLLTGFYMGHKLSFDASLSYSFSLVYLVIFASLIAYTCLYYLNSTIGPAKTGYVALVYTPTSMIISTALEGWSWHVSSVAGIFIVLGSVVLGLRAKNK